MSNGNIEIKRGDIVIVSLDGTEGSEINKDRPALVISNDSQNQRSSLCIIAPISSIKEGTKMKVYYVFLPMHESGLGKDSFIHCGQIRTIDKEKRIKARHGSVSKDIMKSVDAALKVSLSLS